MRDLSSYTVGPTDSIRDAMLKIEENAHRCVVVVDAELHVLGVVSDGDIRRAMLRNTLAMAPVEQIMNMNPRTTTELDPERQRAAIFAAKVLLLPVVDRDNRLVDVYTALEPFGGGDANQS